MPPKKRAVLELALLHVRELESSDTRLEKTALTITRLIIELGGRNVLESVIRNVLMNTPDASKGLRLLIHHRIVNRCLPCASLLSYAVTLTGGHAPYRRGKGGRVDPYVYSVNVARLIGVPMKLFEKH